MASGPAPRPPRQHWPADHLRGRVRAQPQQACRLQHRRSAREGPCVHACVCALIGSEDVADARLGAMDFSQRFEPDESGSLPMEGLRAPPAGLFVRVALPGSVETQSEPAL